MDKLGKAYHISFDKLMSNNSYIYARSSQKGGSSIQQPPKIKSTK